MIHGIGTDIVEYSRIEALWARYGEHFAERVLSGRELEECRSNPNMPRLLAKRFAAKEAVFAIKLKEIKAKELPALDDEFASQFGPYETFEQMKAHKPSGTGNH